MSEIQLVKFPAPGGAEDEGSRKALKMFAEKQEGELLDSVALIAIRKDGTVCTAYYTEAVFALIGSLEELKKRIIENRTGWE